MYMYMYIYIYIRIRVIEYVWPKQGFEQGEILFIPDLDGQLTGNPGWKRCEHTHTHIKKNPMRSMSFLWFSYENPRNTLWELYENPGWKPRLKPDENTWISYENPMDFLLKTAGCSMELSQPRHAGRRVEVFPAMASSKGQEVVAALAVERIGPIWIFHRTRVSLIGYLNITISAFLNKVEPLILMDFEWFWWRFNMVEPFLDA